MKAEAKMKDPKFYEMDGAREAYSNRATVLAAVMSLVALVAVTGFILVRMEPPTVIWVNKGEASVITPSHGAKAHFLPSVLAASAPNAAPNEYEKQAFVKSFLVRYLNYDPYTLSENWADAMNQMTKDLGRSALNDMEKNDTVGKLEDAQDSSSFKLSYIELSKEDPLQKTYTAFGVRTVRSMDNGLEQTTQLVEEYHIGLKDVDRSADHPSGLLIDKFWSHQIEGEKRDAVLADSMLSGRAPTGDSTPANNPGGGTNEQ